MKTAVFVFILFSLSISKAQLPENPFHDIIKTTFYNKEIRGHIFFDYKAIGQQPNVLPAGHYALICPDTIFCKNVPGITHELANSWPKYKWTQSIPYIKDKEGDIIITTNIVFDQNIEFFIVFDKIVISKSKADLVMHTTKLFSDPTPADRYVKIKCSLKRIKGKWEVELVNIEKIACCDKYSDFFK